MTPARPRRRKAPLKPRPAPGTFSGEILATLLVEDGEDTKIRLEEPLCYTTRDGAHTICAPGGLVVDGASIPRFAWSIIGAPLTGDFRRASVIHDIECRLQTRPSADVHRTFREAMAVDGVGHTRRTLMWWAVKTFGPSW